MRSCPRDRADIEVGQQPAPDGGTPRSSPASDWHVELGLSCRR